MITPLKNNKILFIISAVLLIGGASYYAWSTLSPTPEPVSCTLEAKQCPNGSYVGRTGPNCEFAPCPNGNDTSWKTFTDDALGISFKYPENPVANKYMEATDWPPHVQVLNEPFTCTEAGSEIDRAGQTLQQTVSGRTYCVTKVTEGAAGSTYTQYAYAFPKDSKTLIFTFTIRYVQCGNYDDPEKTECENLRTTFDINNVVDQIAQTVRVDSAAGTR